MNKLSNPKLEGSGLIDCIPQKGYCQNRCNSCFFNNGFYLDVNEELPLMPTLEEVGDKVVRVNSGNDSGNQKDLVLKSTNQYPKKFYNTSKLNFDFPAPVVYTCNAKEDDTNVAKRYFDVMPRNEYHIKNVMFFRYRTNMWNLNELPVWFGYLHKRNIPVVITEMRYRNYEDIPQCYLEYYQFKKHIINSYWCLNEKGFNLLRDKYSKVALRCGGWDNYKNSLCKDCGNCLTQYNRAMENRND